MDYSYLNEILILFAVAVGVVILCLRLNLPAILGYLTVGVLVGPYGLALIHDTEHTRELAEFGVVFLLFTIGLEFSLPQLIRMKSIVLGLGGAQVLFSTAITAAIATYLGLPLASAVLLGGIIAMSSTALVIRQLTDQAELHTRHGRNAVGILLFQDIMVIPFLILAATLSGANDDTPSHALLLAAGKGILALALIFAVGHWILQPLFRGVAKHRSAELFTLTVLLVAIGAAWLTSQLGLSLALGAFVAGMMLGETEFRHQIEAEIRPFRDVLLALFFITIGMLFNIKLLPEIWLSVLMVVISLVLFKGILITLLCRLFGWDPAVSLRTGLVLAHGGEFGFAILTLALASDILPSNYGQVILVSLLISMAITPILIRYNGVIVKKVLPSASAMSYLAIEEQAADTTHGMEGHVIICGYGRIGQNIARILESENIPYVAMDLDPTLVQNAIKAKEPVTYGDSANLHLLEAVGLSKAAALVISVNDFNTALKIIHNIRRVNTSIPILVRTTDDSHLEELQKAGATEIIPETMEASLMISSHLLLMLKVPVSRVLQKIRKIRKDRYTVLHQIFPGEDATIISSGETEQLRAIEIPENAAIDGQYIKDLQLDEMNVCISILQHDNRRITNPSHEQKISAGDTVTLYGTPSALDKAEHQLLKPKA